MNYLGEELATVGLQRKGDWFLFNVEPGILGRMGLNISSYRSDGLIGFSPIISVESVEVRTELNRLTCQKSGHPQPSLSSALGYLMPEKRFLEWRLNPNEGIAQRDEVYRMRLALEKYGLVFLRKFGTMRDITHCLETLQFCFKERAVYHLPVVYRVNGKEDQARICIDSHLAEIEGKSDIAAMDFRSFAERFLRTS